MVDIVRAHQDLSARQVVATGSDTPRTLADWMASLSADNPTGNDNLRGIFVGPSGGRVIGDNRNPFVDLVINDVDGDGYIEARLEGDTDEFLAFYFVKATGLGYIELWKPTGTASIDVSPKPGDHTSPVAFSLFRNADTSGRADLLIFKGDATAAINATLSGAGDSFVNALSGEFGIGTDAPVAKLHVHTSDSTEKARFTRADLTLGLSLGYDESGPTNGYIYNRYGSGASAIHFGTGTNFAANRTFTLELGGKATFYGLMQVSTGTASRAQMNFPVSTAPSAPNDGDVWREDNTNTGLKVRINGVTKTITVS